MTRNCLNLMRKVASNNYTMSKLAFGGIFGAAGRLARQYAPQVGNAIQSGWNSVKDTYNGIMQDPNQFGQDLNNSANRVGNKAIAAANRYIPQPIQQVGNGIRNVRNNIKDTMNGIAQNPGQFGQDLNNSANRVSNKMMAAWNQYAPQPVQQAVSDIARVGNNYSDTVNGIASAPGQFAQDVYNTAKPMVVNAATNSGLLRGAKRLAGMYNR